MPPSADQIHPVGCDVKGEIAAARVSVVVPTKDRAALLQQALASIRAVEGPDLAIELIVADNGSSDGSRDVAAGFGAAWVQTLVPGASAARNAGIEAATGEFIAFLDDDDVWLPGHIRPHVQLMRDDPSLGAVIGQVCNASNDLSSCSEPWPASAAAPQQMFKRMLGFYPQIGATVVRSAVARQVGPFDPALASDEDWDWHLRLALATRVGFVAQPCVLFRQRVHGQGDIEWARMGFARTVLLRNVRRAPKSATLVWLGLRAIVQHQGAYAQSFLNQARLEQSSGDSRSAARNLARAMAASPPHVVKNLCANTLRRR